VSTGQIIGSSVLVAALGVAIWRGVVIWKRSRITPEEWERQRRAELYLKGKMGDATLLEVRDHLVFYSYDVRGVEYTASQDISGLGGLLPPDPSAVNGVVYVKYDPRNPANSMILSEDWNGLRNFRCAAQ
jgi:hypothetical protein